MKSLATFLFLFFGLSCLASCGNSGLPVSTADATFAVTDAFNDEVEAFKVGVEKIVLHRTGGDVSVMPNPTEVDFAELEQLTQLLVGQRIPVGIYTGMSMTLDFADAMVCLVGKSTPATILDAAGQPITGKVIVRVNFATAKRPNVAVGRNFLFVFDLHLDQSLAVDLANNRVTFVPVASAEVDPTNPKPVFTRGFLTEVHATSSTLTVERRTLAGVSIGTYAVRVSSTTIYQIDGSNSVGSAGFTKLAALVGGQPRIFIQGTVSTSDRALAAIAIETGKGTPGNGQDYVSGHIVARDNGAGSDAALTVLGSSWDTNGTLLVNTSHTVNVAFSSTNVLRRLRSDGLNTDALNVGQRVIIFGALAGTVMDATSGDGICRILDTSVWGTSKGVPAAGIMTLNLTRIGLRPISAFDFKVGGTTQSDPVNYTVEIGSISTTGVVKDSKIRAIGTMNPVDVGGDADHVARAVVNHSTTAALLLCQWFPANTAALTATSTAVTIDPTNALIKSVNDGFGSTVLTGTAPLPTIEPLLGVGVYSIVENGSVELNLKFDEFAASLGGRIGPQSAVFRVAAIGTFDPATKVFEALVVTVILL